MSTYIITYPRGFDAPGGGTKSFLQIVHNLQKLGVKVITVPISDHPNGGLSQELINNLLGENNSLASFKVVPVKRNKIHYLLNGISTAKAVKKIINEQDVDAVISWEHEAAFMIEFLKSQHILFGMIAANPSYELQFQLENEGAPWKKLINSWFRWRSFKLADLVFVSSKFTLNELVNLLSVNPDCLKITHRGIDAIFFKVKPSNEFGNKSKNTQFIFFGSFAPIKGLPDVIKALGILLKQGCKSWQLNIAGWGDEALIKGLINQENIGDKVNFLGRLNPAELAIELEKNNLAILPSRAESFGRSIAEAQAAGLPVVSYHVGSIPEIVEDGITGRLVSYDRPDLLAEAIQEIMENPEKSLQMGINGSKRTTSLFSWQKTANVIHSSIQEYKKNYI